MYTLGTIISKINLIPKEGCVRCSEMDIDWRLLCLVFHYIFVFGDRNASQNYMKGEVTRVDFLCG